MELLDNFFGTKRKLHNTYSDSRNRGRSCEIALEQVRLLLYKECDKRGRKVLFDSSTINKVPANKNDKPEICQTDKIPCIIEVSGGFAYIYTGPAADASALGEMIFGAVAMNCKSVSLKIHIMNEPRKILCTKVFCVPTSRRVSRVDRKTSEANSSNRLRVTSTPLSVPFTSDEGFALGLTLDRGDSGFCGDQSSYSSFGSTCDYFSLFDSWDGKLSEDTFHSPMSRSLSTSSCGSWQRRTFQNLCTRFDLGQGADGIKVPTASTVSGDSQIYSISSTSGTSVSLASGASLPPRRSKLGLALLITVADTADVEVVRRCVEHSPQLHALVYRLRVATLAAGAGGGFVATLHRAAHLAATWLNDLVYGPRLQPAWLRLVTSDGKAANRLAEELVADLCSVLSVGDRKNTNFFISTLITHVLTHHLGWVTTVSPYDTAVPERTSETPATRRPYNALWAQLNDLCGTIGFPPRAARTIIAGSTNVQFITKLLAVLTYFVRCGAIQRNDFEYQDCVVSESKVVEVNQTSGLKRTATRGDLECDSSLKVPPMTRSIGSSASTLKASPSLKKTTTMASLSHALSTSPELADYSSTFDKPMTSQLRRNPTVMISLDSPSPSSDSSLNSSVSERETEQKVLFVLGDDDKLVGLKNKSNNGKSVKRSSKGPSEPAAFDLAEKLENSRAQEPPPDSPSQCCRQTLQHSKPIKHSGFKFEFDKYPQIVTNYMKSKNLEILDRHYIGKPGNLKLDNFQFDPTIVPPIQEERCEICYKCQLMESVLQTPTNASEMECMNDLPHEEPQYAKETIVEEREMSPKNFVRKRKENTVVVNVKKAEVKVGDGRRRKLQGESLERENNGIVRQVIEFPLQRVCAKDGGNVGAGFESTLLGGVTDHYVPDLVLQGTLANPSVWEGDLRRDLDLTTYLNKALDSPTQSVAIVGDTNTWEVRVVGRECGYGGLSPLVGGMLDALPIMRQARVPPAQCLLYLESKLREFCVLSKTLADMLMSTDFCDVATLTKSLSIDVNDVPLLLAVATTHTPQIATKYGISYR